MASKKKILIAFGKRVRQFRKENGISQEELAFRADLQQTTEKEKNGKITAD